MFNTPILLLIFNRPEATAKVFEEIRKQKPKYLYIGADGPRYSVPEDTELCKKCREIATAIDWDCEVKTLFRDRNLGCGAAPAQAITWFFENVEQGIILEDDIFPDQSFFTFCEQMLNHYKNDDSIMHISGCYFFNDLLSTNTTQSYYFTKHIHVWGWATWKRAWKHYDYDIKDWPYSNSKVQLKNYYGDHYIVWKDIFSRMQHKGNDIWDYQWMFSIYKQNGIAINPCVNLTKNIGFNNTATHTTNPDSIYTKVTLSSLHKIIHPKKIEVNTENDVLYYKHYLNFDLHFEKEKTKISWKLKTILKRLKIKFQVFFR